MNKKIIYRLMDRIYQRLSNPALATLPDDIREQNESYNYQILRTIEKKYPEFYYEYHGIEPFIDGDN